jgi:hypothetical protein
MKVGTERLHRAKIMKQDTKEYLVNGNTFISPAWQEDKCFFICIAISHAIKTKDVGMLDIVYKALVTSDTAHASHSTYTDALFEAGREHLRNNFLAIKTKLSGKQPIYLEAKALDSIPSYENGLVILSILDMIAYDEKNIQPGQVLVYSNGSMAYISHHAVVYLPDLSILVDDSQPVILPKYPCGFLAVQAIIKICAGAKKYDQAEADLCIKNCRTITGCEDEYMTESELIELCRSYFLCVRIWQVIRNDGGTYKIEIGRSYNELAGNPYDIYNYNLNHWDVKPIYDNINSTTAIEQANWDDMFALLAEEEQNAYRRLKDNYRNDRGLKRLTIDNITKGLLAPIMQISTATPIHTIVRALYKGGKTYHSDADSIFIAHYFDQLIREDGHIATWLGSPKTFHIGKEKPPVKYYDPTQLSTNKDYQEAGPGRVIAIPFDGWNDNAIDTLDQAEVGYITFIHPTVDYLVEKDFPYKIPFLNGGQFIWQPNNVYSQIVNVNGKATTVFTAHKLQNSWLPLIGKQLSAKVENCAMIGSLVFNKYYSLSCVRYEFTDTKELTRAHKQWQLSIQTKINVISGSIFSTAEGVDLTKTSEKLKIAIKGMDEAKNINESVVDRIIDTAIMSKMSAFNQSHQFFSDNANPHVLASEKSSWFDYLSRATGIVKSIITGWLVGEGVRLMTDLVIDNIPKLKPVAAVLREHGTTIASLVGGLQVVKEIQSWDKFLTIPQPTSDLVTELVKQSVQNCVDQGKFKPLWLLPALRWSWLFKKWSGINWLKSGYVLAGGILITGAILNWPTAPRPKERIHNECYGSINYKFVVHDKINKTPKPAFNSGTSTKIGHADYSDLLKYREVVERPYHVKSGMASFKKYCENPDQSESVIKYQQHFYEDPQYDIYIISAPLKPPNFYCKNPKYYLPNGNDCSFEVLSDYVSKRPCVLRENPRFTGLKTNDHITNFNPKLSIMHPKNMLFAICNRHFGATVFPTEQKVKSFIEWTDKWYDKNENLLEALIVDEIMNNPDPFEVIKQNYTGSKRDLYLDGLTHLADKLSYKFMAYPFQKLYEFNPSQKEPKPRVVWNTKDDSKGILIYLSRIGLNAFIRMLEYTSVGKDLSELEQKFTFWTSLIQQPTMSAGDLLTYDAYQHWLLRKCESRYIHLIFKNRYLIHYNPYIVEASLNLMLNQQTPFVLRYPGTKLPMMSGICQGLVISGKFYETTLFNTLRNYFYIHYTLRNLNHGKNLFTCHAGDDFIIFHDKRRTKEIEAAIKENFWMSEPPLTRRNHGLGLVIKQFSTNAKCSDYLSKEIHMTPLGVSINRPTARIRIMSNLTDNQNLTVKEHRGLVNLSLSYGGHKNFVLQGIINARGITEITPLDMALKKYPELINKINPNPDPATGDYVDTIYREMFPPLDFACPTQCRLSGIAGGKLPDFCLESSPPEPTNAQENSKQTISPKTIQQLQPSFKVDHRLEILKRTILVKQPSNSSSEVSEGPKFKEPCRRHRLRTPHEEKTEKTRSRSGGEIYGRRDVQRPRLKIWYFDRKPKARLHRKRSSRRLWFTTWNRSTLRGTLHQRPSHGLRAQSHRLGIQQSALRYGRFKRKRPPEYKRPWIRSWSEIHSQPRTNGIRRREDRPLYGHGNRKTTSRRENYVFPSRHEYRVQRVHLCSAVSRKLHVSLSKFHQRQHRLCFQREYLDLELCSGRERSDLLFWRLPTSQWYLTKCPVIL